MWTFSGGSHELTQYDEPEIVETYVSNPFEEYIEKYSLTLSKYKKKKKVVLPQKEFFGGVSTLLNGNITVGGTAPTSTWRTYSELLSTVATSVPRSHGLLKNVTA